MRLDEFLRHFVLAAAAADRRWVRTQDGRDVLAGIVFWEALSGLDEAAPELLVEARLAASMLYARRFELHGEGRDLAVALHEIEAAREHIAPGSFSDMQARMSAAAVWMLRFQAERRPEDLDAAIAAWTALMATEAAPLAAANLGRALLARHDLTGNPRDRRDGRALLGMATAELPADHPARRGVELAFRAAAG